MKYIITMDRKEIMFFCAIFEAVERFCFIRTIDAKRPVIELNVAPDYKKDTEELLSLMARNIKFDILEVLEDE